MVDCPGWPKIHAESLAPANALPVFAGPDIKGILGPAVARALALELAMVRSVYAAPLAPGSDLTLIRLGFLERGQLGLGKDEPVLGHLGLERLETVLHGGEIVALPDAARPGR